jgi:UDP-N-acetylmuramyl pentapeptide phosphotransferase/UDP-N-acetylglucosamine-1-phosphate transferase
MDLHSVIAVGAAILVATWAGAHAYSAAWRAWAGRAGTPTGFGCLMPLAVGGGLWSTGHAVGMGAALAVIILATGLYWLDDIFGLSAKTRLGLASIAGVALGLLGVTEGSLQYWHLLALGLSSGALCVVSANVINFYDGADLNLALLFASCGVLLSVFSPAWDGPVPVIGAALIAFAVGFGMVNRRPQSLYLGDAGSFALAAVVTWLFTLFVAGREVPIEVVAAMALPAFDVFYVLLIRLRFKHDLLSRNYLHLYQRLQIVRGGRRYLYPQVANIALVLGCAQLIGSTAGMSRVVAVLLASAIVTPVLYLVVRRAEVEPEFFFGDGTTR